MKYPEAVKATPRIKTGRRIFRFDMPKLLAAMISRSATSRPYTRLEANISASGRLSLSRPAAVYHMTGRARGRSRL